MKISRQIANTTLISLALALPAFASAQDSKPADASAAPATTPAAAATEPMTVANAPEKVHALIKIDEKIGTGTDAVPGTFVDVNYTGWIYDPKAADRHGVKFDSSVDSGRPMTFQLDARNVIRGWDLGVKGMKVGGKRTLIIPSYLAYGPKGNSVIPPNATLIFDVELVGVHY